MIKPAGVGASFPVADGCGEFWGCHGGKVDVNVARSVQASDSEQTAQATRSELLPLARPSCDRQHRYTKREGSR